MDAKLQKQLSNVPETPEGQDPLRRLFVPIEKPTSDGRKMFQTLDRNVYERFPNGQIINRSRVRGNHKERKKIRRQAREKAAVVQHAND